MKTKTISKRILSILLTLVMALGLLPTGLFSLTAYAYSGTGTEQDPFIATTYDELKAFFRDESGEAVYIRLGADINQEDNLNDNGLNALMKPVSLDLNGHSLSRKCQSLDNYLIKVNQYTQLAIYDSSDDKTGSVYFANSRSSEDHIIQSGGMVVIDGGTFSGNSLRAVIITTGGGTTMIHGGVFHCGNNPLQEHYPEEPSRLGMTGSYPFTVITGGEFYTNCSRSLDCYFPTFIAGGTFYNSNPTGVFANSVTRDYTSCLVFSGGTFRSGLTGFPTNAVFAADGVIQKSQTIDGVEYTNALSPVVITDGFVHVSDHLLSKCIDTWTNYINKFASTAISDEMKNRYSLLFLNNPFSTTMETIKIKGFTAPKLSIQHPKTSDCVIEWYQSEDGVNFTTIPKNNGEQSIKPPNVTKSCTMYYRCGYLGKNSNNEYITSQDTIKVVYTEIPTTKVSYVYIGSLNKPRADQPLDFSMDDTTQYTVDEVRWVDLDTGKYLSDGALCIGNHTYRCSLVLSPKEGYKFTSDTSVINLMDGFYNQQIQLSSGALDISFDVWTDYAYISSFDITGVTPPVPGEHPDFTAESVDGKTVVTEVEWCQLFDDFKSLTATDVFEDGKEYQCQVTFEGKESAGYWLDNVTITGKVGGKTATASHIDGKNVAYANVDYTSGIAYFGLGKLTEANLQNAYAAIRTGVGSKTASINLASYGLTKEQLEKVWELYRFDHPEHYWLPDGYTLSMSGNTVAALNMVYLTGFNDATFTAEANKLLQAADGQYDDYDKALALHDALIKHVANDSTAPFSRNAYGAIVGGKAMSDGYARAYQYLLQRVGIQSYIITGTANDENHTWNLVRLGYDYYHTDVTLDDPTVASGDAGKPVFYPYFNLTPKTMQQQTHTVFDTYSILNTPCYNDDKMYAGYFQVYDVRVAGIKDKFKTVGTQEVARIYYTGPNDAFGEKWWGFNHAAVAEELGVPDGSITAFFVNREIYLAYDPNTAGVKVSGNYTAFGEATDDICIQLIPSTGSEAAYEFTDNTANAGAWSMDGVVAGTYIVKVMKNKHCTEKYTITVSGSAVTLNVEIWLLGDMDMNGLIDSRDALKLFNAAAGKTTLTEQENRIGDMNLSGGDVNMLDAQKLFNMAAGVVTL